MAAILNPICRRERLPRRKGERNGKRKRASSVSLFRDFIQIQTDESKSFDQLHPLNEISPALLETVEQISDTDVVVAIIISISSFNIMTHFKCL